MFKIVNNERLSDNMFRVTFEAPLVARKAQPGQFLMFRVDEFGERMPITISSYDREAGTVSVIMQRVGSTTALLASKKAGDYVADVVGPLGNPAEFDNMHKIVVVGGGDSAFGCARGPRGPGRRPASAAMSTSSRASAPRASSCSRTRCAPAAIICT